MPLGAEPARANDLGACGPRRHGSSSQGANARVADSGRVAGNGSCNRFTGSVRLTGESISFSPLAATRMACLDSALTQQETTYFQALQGAERFRVDGNTRFIHSKDRAQSLRFTKQ